MGVSRRIFTREMKLAALERLRGGSRVAEVARAFEVAPNVLHRWRREFGKGPGNAFPGVGQRRWEQQRLEKLERMVGRQAVEIDFLKECLQTVEEERKLQALTGNPRPTRRSRNGSRTRTGR